jgi:polysaccharide pyruvyl transferase WcaK-like protein
MSLAGFLPAPVRRAISRSVPRHAPRIGLVGFYGWGNYGDELFIDAFRPVLNRVGPMAVLPEIPHNPYYHRPVEQIVSQNDALVIGGGDLVQPWRNNPLYWNRAYLAKPVFIYGIGAPVSPDIVVKPHIVAKLRNFFQHPNVKYIGVRDHVSKQWIDANLEPNVEVRVHADLVCAIDLPSAERPDGPPILGIVTRQRNLDRPDTYEQVEKLARTAQGKGFRIRHIVLGTGLVGQRDLDNADELHIEDKELLHSENLDDLSRWIGECRVLASMKFHGTVVATMYGTPSICMMPTPKNVHFLTGIGRADLLSQFMQPDLFEKMAGDVPPLIDEATILRLRNDARAGLAELADAVHTNARGRRRGKGNR